MTGEESQATIPKAIQDASTETFPEIRSSDT